MAKRTPRTAGALAQQPAPGVHENQQQQEKPPPIIVRGAVENSPSSFAGEFTPEQRKLERARRQRQTVLNGEARLRRDMLDDRRFRLGRLGDQFYQWPDGLASDRTRNGRPILQVNRTAGFVDMARNPGDNANLRLRVSPVDDLGDPDVAIVLQGLMRNVETRSFAEDAYNTAGDGQCEMGRGYVWLHTEFESNDTNRQRAVLKRILNPFRIKVDVSAEMMDQSDAEFSFLDTDLDEDTWKDRYGKGKGAGGGDRIVPTPADVNWGDGPGDQAGDWFPSQIGGGHRIRVMHWFCVEREPDTLYELKEALPDGREYLKTETLEAEVHRIMSVADAKAMTKGRTDFDTSEKAFAGALKRFKQRRVLRSRPIETRVIKWRVIDALYVHQETIWPTPWQPLIPMVGNESDLDGDKDVRGVVRDVKDSQRIYNVEVSSKVEIINSMPKAPWLGPQGAFGKPQTAMNEAWRTANTTNHAYLEYEVVDIDGGHDPRPQRAFSEPYIQGVNSAIQQSDSDMKATARIHDASLGERGPQESGAAITARQRQDETANSHYTKNRRRCIASVGRQLIQLFRTIYDVATVVRIIGAADREEKVMVFSGPDNDPRQDDPKFKLPDGVKGIYDIGAGEYDVEVDAAPDPGSRRKEDLAMVSEAMKVMPPDMASVMMDLLFGLIDSPVGRKLEERAKLMLPKQFRDQTDKDGGPEVPPEVRAEMEEMRKQGQQLVEALKNAEEMLRTKKLELDSKEKIETMRQYVELVKMLVQEDSEGDKLILKAEIERIGTFMDGAIGQLDAAEKPAATPV